LNIFSTPLFKFSMFLLELFDKVSLQLPLHLFRLVIKEIDDHRPYFVGSCCCGCFPKPSSSKSPPAPTSTEAVVEGIQRLLVVCHLNGDDRDIATRLHLSPAFRL